MLPIQRSKVLTSKPFALPNWRTATVAMLLVAVMTAVLFPASGALADDADSTGESDGTGIKVGAWAATVPYIIAKGTFAACGAVVGGLGYVFSGLDDRVAKAVWTRSIYGTYIIRPAHLRGEEAVRFLGEEPERRDDSIAPLDQAPPPESVAP
jgi:hypothetical protein